MTDKLQINLEREKVLDVASRILSGKLTNASAIDIMTKSALDSIIYQSIYLAKRLIEKVNEDNDLI
jgi:hypothetical protein